MSEPDTGATIDRRIGARGVWWMTEGMSSPETTVFAASLESLGYGAWWIPETVGRDPFVAAAHVLGATDRLVMATGIANIFHRHPGAMKQAQYALAEQSGGRFLLGMGVSHAPLVAGLRKLDYSKPRSRMQEYLDAMAGSPYRGPAPEETPRTLLAALGPKMLELAGQQADGAHPYWTTPEHTGRARSALGAGKLLCVEQKVVLSTDPAEARATAREALSVYLGLPNYEQNWFRLGFTEDDLVDNGSDRLVDALVAWGSADRIEARLGEHLDAGADHVCIQPLTPGAAMSAPHRPALEALAPS